MAMTSSQTGDAVNPNRLRLRAIRLPGERSHAALPVRPVGLAAGAHRLSGTPAQENDRPSTPETETP